RLHHANVCSSAAAGKGLAGRSSHPKVSVVPPLLGGWRRAARSARLPWMHAWVRLLLVVSIGGACGHPTSPVGHKDAALSEPGEDAAPDRASSLPMDAAPLAKPDRQMSEDLPQIVDEAPPDRDSGAP